MKHLFPAFLFAFAILLSGCSKENLGPNQFPQNFFSQICPNVSGFEAIYWDFSNGIPRSDIPGGVLQVPSPQGGHFQHPTQLLLNFTYPVGWSPQTISDSQGQTAGVNLIRNDNQSIWRWVTGPASSNLTATDAIAFEINQIINYLGAQGQIQVVCTKSDAKPINQGMFLTSEARLLRVGNFTINVNVQITTVEIAGGNFLNFASAQLAAGPTAEFNNLISDVYFPVFVQLLIPNTDSSFEDKDQDGWPVSTDPDDNNPNVP